MHSIKRISAMTLLYTKKYNIKKKTKNLMTAVSISTAGVYAFYNSAKVLPSLMKDEFSHNGSYISKPIIKRVHITRTKPFPINFNQQTINSTSLFGTDLLKFKKTSSHIAQPMLLTEENTTDAIQETMKKVFQKQIHAVTGIMEEDKFFTSHHIKDSIAEHIVTISQKYEINPLHIACIAKKESHFTPNLNGKGAKGMMQITMGAVKPMYKYPQNFSPKLDEIKKIYPTAEKLFEALGTNVELNIEIGTIYFQACLKFCKGNLQKALEMYNNSSKKEQYAQSVLKNIKKYG